MRQVIFLAVFTELLWVVAGKHKIADVLAPYVVSGLFPAKIERDSPSYSSIVYSEVMRFATNDVNKNILKNVTKLGYVIYDSYGETQTKTIVQICVNTLSKVSQQHWTDAPCNCTEQTSYQHIGFVGPGYSTAAILVNDLTKPSPISIISYTATSSVLSNKERFPYFLRTIPSDQVLSEVVIDIILRHKWKFVSIIASDNTFGRSGRKDLIKLLKQNDICLDIDALFNVPYENEQLENIVKSLKDHSHKHQGAAKAIILYAVSTPSKMILNLVARHNLTDFTWILVDTSRLSHWFQEVSKEVMAGLLAISQYAGKYTEFEEHLESIFKNGTSDNPWFNKVLTTKDHDYLRERFLTIMPLSGYVRNAVHAFATALKSYLLTERRATFDSEVFMTNYLSKVKFVGTDGQPNSFNIRGDIKNPMFHILNIYANESEMWIENVGNWTRERGLTMKKRIMWDVDNFTTPSSACSKTCGPGTSGLIDLGRKCCWTCVPCLEGYIKEDYGEHACAKCQGGTASNPNNTVCLPISITTLRDNKVYLYTVYALILVGVLFGNFILITVFLYRVTPVIRACNKRLTFIQLTAHICLYLALLLFVAEPSMESCTASVVLIGFKESFIIAVMLSKTEQLIKIFEVRAKLTDRDILINNRIGALFIFIVCVIQTLLTSMLFAFDKIGVDSTFVDKTHVEKYCFYDYFFAAQCSFTTVLAIICGFQAFRSRNLPNKYNEARNILYATFMKLLFTLLITLVLAVIDNGFKKHFLIFVVLFTSNTLVLSTIFGQKIYIILKKPEENTRVVFQSAILANQEKRKPTKSSTSPAS